MSCKINLADLVVQEAQRQGVDPGVALAVARNETSVCQWRSDGSVVIGSAGEVGMFQLMPDTAMQLGVDPYDVNQNIRGGVTYLRQLFQKYGSWDKALAAYNWGPGKLDKAAAQGTSLPSSVIAYVKKALGISPIVSAGIAANPATAAPIMATITAGDLISNLVGSSSKIKVGAVLVVGGTLALAIMLGDD